MMEKSSFNLSIDLRGTPCPLNYVRCKLALEDLEISDSLLVILDKGEPQEMVIPGLINEGHKVDIINESSLWVEFIVICGKE